MPKITVDVYEIVVKMVIRKDYWKQSGKKMSEKILKDDIEEGIEVPVETMDIKIME
jgi:hypothetical protein